MSEEGSSKLIVNMHVKDSNMFSSFCFVFIIFEDDSQIHLSFANIQGF